jgi:hypothetical protein
MNREKGLIVLIKESDNIFHPPSGSSVPGKVDANPYMSYPPSDLRELVNTEEDPENLKKIKSALKQWERVWQEGYLFKKADILRVVAHRFIKAEVLQPARNLDYYQDLEVPEGFESALEGMQNFHDNEDYVRFDYTHQGERPIIEVDFLKGDFLSPHDRVFENGTVTPRGDGADPDGMECTEPPTGGNLDPWPDSL